LRWGRVEECFGEDPYLVGVFGTAYIKGIQQIKPDGRIKAAATAKHFIGHGSPTGGLNLSSVLEGEYEMKSLYFPPFEMAVKEGKVASIMNAYSSYNHVPLVANKYLLTNVLRKQWNFSGYVYSDWGSIEMQRFFHYTALNNDEAGLKALLAGVDLEAPESLCFANIESMVKKGLLKESVIDKAVKRILSIKFLTGLFDYPFANIYSLKNIIHNESNQKLALQIAEESIVLLKNDNGFLPLDDSKIKSIAVIGPNAGQVQFGDYTWSKNNKDGINLLQGLQNFAGDKIKLNYAKGCGLYEQDSTGFSEAVLAAKKSDIAIVVIGTTSASLSRDYINPTSGEGYDLTDLNPTGYQEHLIKSIHATGKPTIVILIQGKPFSIPWIKENIPAIIEAWYPGEQGGTALANIIFGKTNPSGKLSVSFPQSIGHLPAYYNYLPTDKGFYHQPGTLQKPGRDYVFSSPDVLWPFGFGLSYSNFSFNNLIVNKKEFFINDTLKLQFKLSNNSNTDGKEVVQLYIRDLVSSVVTPVKQLKQFKKIMVTANQSELIKMELPIKELWLINAEGKKVVEPGAFEIMVGNSSNDIKMTGKIIVR
jgi:beta-glucosidase